MLSWELDQCLRAWKRVSASPPIEITIRPMHPLTKHGYRMEEDEMRKDWAKEAAIHHTSGGSPEDQHGPPRAAE
jgi:hypothetical protein